MNSPTIAAVVPGLKPPAERSPDAAGTEQGASFANVLADQAAPPHAGDVPAEAVQTRNGSGSEELAQGGALPDPEAADNADTDDKALEAAVASLPRIALEIALQAQEQAARDPSARRQASIADAESALRTPTLRGEGLAAGPGIGPDRLATKAALRSEAAAAHAGDGQNANRLRNAQGAAGIAGVQIIGAHSAMAGFEPAGPLRVAPHQTSLRSAISDALSSRGDAASRLNATLAADKNPGPRGAIDPAVVASMQGRFESDHAALEGRLQPQPLADMAATGLAASTSGAAVNPFAQPVAASPATAPLVATPVHQPGWNADFGRQVVMLARDAHSGTHTAELRLDPPELGPLRISLSLNEGMASAMFVSAHASVRQAVEAALPQLSQQLAQAGISLGETHVGDQGQAGFAFNESNGRPRSGGSGAAQNSLPADASPPAGRPVAANSLVDTFA